MNRYIALPGDRVEDYKSDDYRSKHFPRFQPHCWHQKQAEKRFTTLSTSVEADWLSAKSKFGSIRPKT